ncbi:uncharacterized protein AKAME5_003008500, partial [Lates japonicus]
MPLCPLCHRSFSALNKHLKSIHNVANNSERQILLNHAAGRINIRASSCPVSGCTYLLTRLDRHIRQAHTEMSVSEQASMMAEARRQATRKLLADLQATDPDPPMASTLALEDDVFEEIQDSPGPPSPEYNCGDERCWEQRRIYTVELDKLRQQRDSLLQDIGVLRSKLQLHERRSKTPKRRSTPTDHATGQKEHVEEPKQLQQQTEEQQQQEQWQEEEVKQPKVTPVKRPFKQAKYSPKSFGPWSSGQGRGNRMRLIMLPASMEEYLQTYKAFHEGLDPTPKMRENALSKVSRVKTFLLYMGHSHSRLSDWLFLDDLPRIRGWSRSVVISGMKITTAEFYLKNFLESTPLPPDQGTAEGHSPEVDHGDQNPATTGDCPPDGNKECTVLKKMEAKLTHGDRFMFYGYLSAYWSCLYSHRPGVYTNLTDQEIEEARASGGGFLLHVKEHKTNKTFGEAQIFLTPEEFSWVERWVAIKAQDGYSYL